MFAECLRSEAISLKCTKLCEQPFSGATKMGPQRISLQVEAIGRFLKLMVPSVSTVGEL